jgi:hypothetical protein
MNTGSEYLEDFRFPSPTLISYILPVFFLFFWCAFKEEADYS